MKMPSVLTLMGHLPVRVIVVILEVDLTVEVN